MRKINLGVTQGYMIYVPETFLERWGRVLHWRPRGCKHWRTHLLLTGQLVWLEKS